MSLFRWIFIIILLSGLISCERIFTPDLDLSNFSGITETHETGAFIGKIDQNDWSEISYSNVLFGTDFWLSPFNYISLQADSTSLTDTAVLRFYNESASTVELSANTNSLFSVAPEVQQVNYTTLSFINASVQLPDLQDTTYYDTLKVTLKNQQIVTIPLRGRLFNALITTSDMPVPETCIYPAYPNPCDQVVTIRFSVAETSEAILYIVNKNGKIIETLLKNTLNLGEHSVIWNVSNVESGFYRVFFEVSGYQAYGDIQIEH